MTIKKNVIVNSSILIVFFQIMGCSHSKVDNGAHDNYLKNAFVSDSLGTPSSDAIFYYPFNIKLGNETINSDLDTLGNRFYSSMLYAFKEPVLYNYYLNQDEFRLLIIESWNNLKIIDVKFYKENILVETKTMNVQSIYFFPKNKNNETDLKEKVNYIFNKKEIIGGANKFNQVIENSNFWKMKNIYKDGGLDGTRVILEAHTKNNYWFISRWEPRDEDLKFKYLCNYIAELAGEKITW
jgi:hypothetical protein